MSGRAMLIFAAISSFIFVGFGAFGAHVLSQSLGPQEMSWIDTGLRYQGYHALAIFGLASVMLRRTNIWFYWSSIFLAFGTLLFSGSLYCLALTHLEMWAWVTPIGGFCFLTGWALMLTGALRIKARIGSDE